MKTTGARFTLLFLCAALVALPSLAVASSTSALSPSGIARLEASTDGAAQVRTHRVTGAARFVRLDSQRTDVRSLLPSAAKDATPASQSELFFRSHGDIFGVRSFSQELRLDRSHTDQRGGTHLTYRQVYQGIPVFGAELKTHFDAHNNLRSINGTFVPGIALSITPVFDAAAAGQRALDTVREQRSDAKGLTVLDSRLVVYRAGLLQGVAGSNHLAYEIEVGNRSTVREFVYVSAKTRKVLNQITGIHTAIDREVHEMTLGNLVWQEGDAYPTGNIDWDNELDGALETYNLFVNTFNYTSWDGMDGTMITVNNDPTIACPNANWNGTTTNYCTGVTGDDTVAHEWGHAYTDSTHNLIYQWQSGALNESYSDIWGEVVDVLNGRGTDSPNPARAAGDCSIYGGSPPPYARITSPPAIVGDLVSTDANFNPPGAQSIFNTNVSIVNDGTGTTTDGCEPLIGFPAGDIAIIDRGSCNFTVKVLNAQAAGAVAAIVVNNVAGDPIPMGGAAPGITIRAQMIRMEDGDNIKANEPGPGVRMRVEWFASTNDSYRWLSGEDDPAFGGAIRDMWNPTCFGDPGRVSDELPYHCDTTDSGGVHINSGVPNHAFALLVDGGTYNGETISSIGLTKAAHLYWRAQSVYQTISTNFTEHADALAQSCQDLIGMPLTDPSTDTPGGVGEMISQTDCDQVDKAIAAVELHTEPTFCNFQPLLDPNTPDTCVDSTPYESHDFFDNLDTNPGSDWTLANMGVFAEYVPRDWEWTSELPEGGTGSAFFGIDSVDIGDCMPGSDDQSGVMMATSPEIDVTSDAGYLRFRHYVATEPLWDGGNLKIRVNGGAWQLVPGTAITWNTYPGSINTTAQGNTNPLQGEEGYTGTDGGTVGGSWAQSIVDLAGLVSNGDTLEIRYDLGVDGCNGSVGWYIDDVEVFSCTDVNPSIFADGFESGDTAAWVTVP